MPKFYVQSGSFKFIINAIDAYSSVNLILQKYKGKGMMFAPSICTNEEGFISNNNQICFDTDSLIRKNK